jgi:phage-related minor tail protein
MVPAIVSALTAMATLGMPVLEGLIGALESLVGWFNNLLEQQDANKLWQALDAVWQIITNIGRDLGPMAGAILALGLDKLADLVLSIADNWKTWGPIIDGIVAALVLLGATMLIVKAAMAVGPLLNPWTLLIAAVVGIGVAMYQAYQKGGQFRRGADQLFGALKAIAQWVATAFVDAFDGVKAAISWVIEKVKWLLDKLSPVADKVGSVAHAVGSVKGPSGIDLIKGAFATGGQADTSGPYLVGERGPEVVDLPRGAAVTPGAGGGTEVINLHATLVTPNGEVLARQTLRAARRKRSLS